MVVSSPTWTPLPKVLSLGGPAWHFSSENWCNCLNLHSFVSFDVHIFWCSCLQGILKFQLPVVTAFRPASKRACIHRESPESSPVQLKQPICGRVRFRKGRRTLLWKQEYWNQEQYSAEFPQNHRIVKVWRDLWRSSSLAPLPRQGHCHSLGMVFLN